MFKTLTKDGAQWTVREGMEEIIPDELFQKLSAPDKDHGYSLIRENNIRSSFLVSTGKASQPGLFIKRYKCRGLQDAVKFMLLPSKAASEWRALKKFEEMHLPCPRPLAFSEKKSFGILRDSCLITESLAPAVALNEYAGHAHVPGPTRRGLANALALLIQKLHAGGIYYRDLHAGNILIHPSDSGIPELFLIDLHRAYILPGLLRWMRAHDIAQLCNSLPASQADGLRFLKAYCRAGNMSNGLFHALQEKICGKRLKLEQRRIKSRSKRCMKNSTVFEKLHAWPESYCGRKDFGKRAADNAITLHIVQQKSDRGAAVKQTSKSVLTRHILEGHVPFCVKEYRFLGALYAAKNLFKKSRAMKSWIAAHGLLVRGLATPLPLAIVEKKWGPCTAESFLITRWLTNVLELNEYIKNSALQQSRGAFIKSLALTLRKMHDKAIYHADLKSNNILVEERGAGAWEFYFVDLDRVYFKKSSSFYERANNLAQINASVSGIMTIKDRLSFFHFYAKGTTAFAERKKYYRKILEISRTKNSAPYGILFT